MKKKNQQKPHVQLLHGKLLLLVCRWRANILVDVSEHVKVYGEGIMLMPISLSNITDGNFVMRVTLCLSLVTRFKNWYIL